MKDERVEKAGEFIAQIASVVKAAARHGIQIEGRASIQLDGKISAEHQKATKRTYQTIHFEEVWEEHKNHNIGANDQ